MADKGSHIPARAMLGFQGTVIFIYYQGLDVIHQVFVAFHFRLGTEGLVDDEVVVAFESMAVDAGVIISVAGYELLQFCRCLRKVFNVEGYVLDEASGSRLAGASHGGEDAGTDGPVSGIFLRTVGEAYRNIGCKGLQASFDGRDVLLQFFRGTGFGFGQHCSQSSFIAGLHAGEGGGGNFAFVFQEYGVVDGGEALIV